MSARLVACLLSISRRWLPAVALLASSASVAATPACLTYVAEWLRGAPGVFARSTRPLLSALEPTRLRMAELLLGGPQGRTLSRDQQQAIVDAVAAETDSARYRILRRVFPRERAGDGFRDPAAELMAAGVARPSPTDRVLTQALGASPLGERLTFYSRRGNTYSGEYRGVIRVEGEEYIVLGNPNGVGATRLRLSNLDLGRTHTMAEGAEAIRPPAPVPTSVPVEIARLDAADRPLALVRAQNADVRALPDIRTGIRNAARDGQITREVADAMIRHIDAITDSPRTARALATILREFGTFVDGQRFTDFGKAWTAFVAAWAERNGYHPVIIRESLDAHEFARSFAPDRQGRPGILMDDVYFEKNALCRGVEGHGRYSHGLQAMLGHTMEPVSFKRIMTAIGRGETRQIGIDYGPESGRNGFSNSGSAWGPIFDEVSAPAGLLSPINTWAMFCIFRDRYETRRAP